MKATKVKLTNRVAYLELSRKQYKTLDKQFRFRQKGYQYVPAYKAGAWDGYTHPLGKNGRCPSGLIRTFKDKLKLRFKITEEFTPVYFNRGSFLTSDRQFQNECVLKMAEASTFGGGLIINATGSGKTRIAGMYFKWLEGSGIFVVDERTLLYQAKRELAAVVGEKIGIVGDSKFRPKRITVCTIQTLHKHRNHPVFRQWTKDLDVVIVDEVHVQMNRRNFQTVASINPPAVFGLTATLALRKKSVRMKAHALCGPVVYTYPLERGQEEGYLDHGVVIQIEHKKLKRKGRGKNAYHDEYNQLIVDSEKRNQIIIQLAKEAVKRGKYVVILVLRPIHIRQLSEKLHNIPHRLAFGGIRPSDRRRATKAMDQEKVNLIIANKVFSKGVDIRRLDVIISGHPSSGWEEIIQKFGRGARKHKNKRGFIFIDVYDVGNRFEKSAEKRLSAFKRAGIPPFRIPANRTEFGYKRSLKKILDIAEQQLWKKRFNFRVEAILSRWKKLDA